MRMIVTVLKVGSHNGLYSAGTSVTREAIERALQRGPIEGVERLWCEGDALMAEVEVTSNADIERIFRGVR
ncbi:hypothetical protein Rctr197k_105 [Virus Rctr197k]|nr:hypothetical protein Rctr197k_105 [Virus Rctr197k]